MQLVENKRPTPFLIAEISAIRKFAPHFRAQQSGAGPVILSAAKSACHSPAARRPSRDLASALPAPPSPPFRALWTRQDSGDRTVTAFAKGRIFQVANRRGHR